VALVINSTASAIAAPKSPLLAAASWAKPSRSISRALVAELRQLWRFSGGEIIALYNQRREKGKAAVKHSINHVLASYGFRGDLAFASVGSFEWCVCGGTAG
jgi:hypothetical protein